MCVARLGGDLLFEGRGVWRVVEVKTDRINDADAMREHAAQMAAYARSLAHLVGVQPQAALCLVRHAQVLEF